MDLFVQLIHTPKLLGGGEGIADFFIACIWKISQDTCMHIWPKGQSNVLCTEVWSDNFSINFLC